MGTTGALSCPHIPSLPCWNRDSTPRFQLWVSGLQQGIPEGFATNFETFLAVLWNKEEFLECAQGWGRARRRLSLVMVFFGMLGVLLDTPVLDGQLQALLLEGWELGI